MQTLKVSINTPSNLSHTSILAMETQQLQLEREKGSNQEASPHESREDQRATTPPPPSPTSSPSHEFSFTISLHPCPNSTPTTTKSSKSAPPTFEIDLSPADDIFFHGHLLPLHLSRLAVSPRPSDISIEDLNLPIKGDQSPKFRDDFDADTADTKGRRKPKSISSLFGLTRWRKEREDRTKEEINTNNNNKKKRRRFDIRRIWSIMQPLLFFKGEKEKSDLRRRPYSFSGNLSPRGRDGGRRRRRGELSLPASMRTSPTNSGLLLAGAPTAFSTSDESTMEELQNAIQAAIAHCKNSIAIKEDKCKF